MARSRRVVTGGVCTVEELVDELRQPGPFRLFGTDSHQNFRTPSLSTAKSLRLDLTGVVAHDRGDQVITVRANTTLSEMQSALSQTGQCIPYLPFHAMNDLSLEKVSGTLAGHVSMNFPHAYESSLGSWRDWILGAKVVLSDGVAAKCGSKVVKSVAGYDIHRFLIGSRGTLAVFTEITLRTFSLASLPKPDLIAQSRFQGDRGLIRRSLASNFSCLLDEHRETLLAQHPATSTLYCSVAEGRLPDPPKEGWQLGWGLGSCNVNLQSEVDRYYFERSKTRFDPQGKLNPAEWGGQNLE